MTEANVPTEHDGPAADPFLEQMTRPAAQEVMVAGRLLRPGDRVLLRPRQGGDIIDLALAGRIAVIEGIDEDDAGAAHVAVVVEDDPGRDLGEAHNPAHRFFFDPGELEPLDARREPLRRVLVAGIGNVFYGDDGFGVAVARTLASRAIPEGVEVVDFGVRGLDLAYALGAGYHAAILIDAVPGAGEPGTLGVIEPDQGEGEEMALEWHQMNPLSVMKLARSLGDLPSRLFIVGCHPLNCRADSEDPFSMELSAPVAAAVERAADIVVELACRLTADGAT